MTVEHAIYNNSTSTSQEEAMLSTRSLMATLLVLVPVTGSPVLGHLLVLWEGWSGHILEYQQILVPATKNCSCKTSGNVILDQSAQKRGIRNYSGFRTNMKTSRKNAYRNYQLTILLKYVILCKRNLYRITDGTLSVQFLRKHLGRSELILRRKNMLRNILNRKCDGYEVKVNWQSILNGAKKKPETKRKEQLQITYFENRHKPVRGGPLLSYLACQANMLKVEEAYFPKNQEHSKKKLMLRFVKLQIPIGKVLTEAEVLQKKTSKNNSNRIFTIVKERVFSKQNTNTHNKEQIRMTDGKKLLNEELKSQYMGFKKYDQSSKSFQHVISFPIRENIKFQKWKTRTKNSISANEKFQFIHAFTYQRSHARKQKIFSAHEHVMPSIQQIKESAFQIKMYGSKKSIKLAKWLRAKENRSRENGIEVLSRIYYVLPSLISPTFLTIKTAVGLKNEVLTLKMDEASVFMTKRQPSKRIQKKYLSDVHKGFLVLLKALLVRKLGTEESLPILLYLFKHKFKGASVVERMKRSANAEAVPTRLGASAVETVKQSAKAETVRIPLDVLNRVTSALIACATIFGLILFTLALAAGYLYYNRRHIIPFLQAGLKGEESRKEWKHVASQCCPPISVSQNFHFGQPQEIRKNELLLAAAPKTCSKEEFVIMKELHGSSDTEVSSEISSRGLTIRSRAIVLPSRSSDSIQSVFDVRDDVSSQQSVTIDNGSSTVPPKTDLVPVPQQPNNQEQSTSNDVSSQPKKTTVSKSKSDNDLPRPSKVLQADQPDHCLYDVKEPSTSKDVTLNKPTISEPKPDNAIMGPSSTEASQGGQTQTVLKSEPDSPITEPSSTGVSQTDQTQTALKSEPDSAVTEPSSTEASQGGQTQAILKSEPGIAVTGPLSTEKSQGGQTQAILKSEPDIAATGPLSTEISQAGQKQEISNTGPDSAVIGIFSTTVSKVDQALAISTSDPDTDVVGLFSTTVSQVDQAVIISPFLDSNIPGPFSTEVPQAGQTQNIVRSEPENAILSSSSTIGSQMDHPLTNISTVQNP